MKKKTRLSFLDGSSDDEYDDDVLDQCGDSDLSETYYDNDDFEYTEKPERKKKSPEPEDISDDDDAIDDLIQTSANDKETPSYAKDPEWWKEIVKTVNAGPGKAKKKAESDVIDLMDKWIQKIASTRFRSFLPREWEDLIQIGRTAVIVYLPQYEPDKAAPSNYFFRHIYHEMLVYTQKFSSGMTRHYSDMNNKIKKIKRKIVASGEKPESWRIIELSGGTISKKTIEHAEKASEANGTVSFEDLVSTPTAQKDESPEASLEKKELSETISRAIGELPEDIAEIIRLSFGLDGRPELTSAEIAKKLHCSAETVRYMKMEGIRKLTESKTLSGIGYRKTEIRKDDPASYAQVPEDILGSMSVKYDFPDPDSE